MDKIINSVDFVTTTVMANYPIHWLIENLGLVFITNNLRMDWKLYRLFGKLCYLRHGRQGTRLARFPSDFQTFPLHKLKVL